MLVQAVRIAAREAERSHNARVRQVASQQRATEAEYRRQEKERQANLRRQQAALEKMARRGSSLAEAINKAVATARNTSNLSTKLTQLQAIESKLAELRSLRSESTDSNYPGTIRIENLSALESALEEIRHETEQMQSDNQRKQDLSDNLQDQVEDAAMRRETLQKTLLHTLDIDDAILWDQLKDHSAFNVPPPIELPRPFIPPKPSAASMPAKPALLAMPSKPDKQNAAYRIPYPLALFLLKPLWRKQRRKKLKAYRADFHEWKKNCRNTKEANVATYDRYEKTLRRCETEAKLAVEQWQAEADRLIAAWEADRREQAEEWERSKREFLAARQAHNEAIDSLEQRYKEGHPAAIAEYCERVLERSQYPADFPQQFDLHYQPDNKLLLVEYMLPAMEVIPTLKTAQLVKSTGEIKETHIPQKQVHAIYDDLLYQIALRTLHELFEADVTDALENVVFNGLARLINKATGKEETRCILSLQASKAEFLHINLEKIEPKECFRALKGIASSQLHGLTPVAPILQLNKDDKRFIEAVSVSDTLNEGVNLAAMDWQSFEYLVREIFAKEFNASGGEVKVTQSSRDGGVDAIAFDPDPIRGGKIVIQAKRYTNVVGVSAVRDLYGTVLNEGASKGILITTAYFGTDAYEFARNKPLTLLNGGNLLHLLEKHGTKARIDLREAKAAERFVSTNEINAGE